MKSPIVRNRLGRQIGLAILSAKEVDMKKRLFYFSLFWLVLPLAAQLTNPPPDKAPLKVLLVAPATPAPDLNGPIDALHPPAASGDSPFIGSTFSRPLGTFSRPGGTFSRPVGTFSQPAGTFTQPGATVGFAPSTPQGFRVTGINPGTVRTSTPSMNLAPNSALKTTAASAVTLLAPPSVQPGPSVVVDFPPGSMVRTNNASASRSQ